MAAFGRICRVLSAGMISLMLAAVSYGASAVAAAGPDPTDARRASGDGIVALPGEVAPARDANNQSGSFVPPTAAELDTIIRHTFSVGDLQALVGQAAGAAAPEVDPRVSKLAAALGLEAEALARMFEVLGAREVPPAQLPNVLAELAARHLSLLDRVRLLEGSEPGAADLLEAAAAAIGTAEYDRADALLAEAAALGFEPGDQFPEALDLSAVPAARTYARVGAIAALAPRYGRAAASGATLRGGDRANSQGPPPTVPSDRFCQGHPGHPLCERWAATAPLCERLPDHPLCQGENAFCRRHPDHKLCEQPPSPS